MKSFKQFVIEDSATVEKINALKSKVEAFAEGFPMPGFDNH
jgi:hypothetical protein